MLHDRMMNDRANGVGLTMRNVDFLINDVQLSRLPGCVASRSDRCAVNAVCLELKSYVSVRPVNDF